MPKQAALNPEKKSKRHYDCELIQLNENVSLVFSSDCGLSLQKIGLSPFFTANIPTAVLRAQFGFQDLSPACNKVKRRFPT